MPLMSRHFLFKLGIPLILLVVVATGTYAYVLNGAKSNALHTLGALGFTNPNIGETKYQKGHAFHLNTQIDDQNLSTLELISNPLPLPSGQRCCWTYIPACYRRHRPRSVSKGNPHPSWFKAVEGP